MKNTDFANLYNTHYSKTYNYVYYRLLNRENAEDVVSDVFLKAMNSIDRFDGKQAQVSTWLFTIAANSVNNYVRKNRKFTLVQFEDNNTPDVSSAGIENELVARDNAQRLNQFLKTLDERSRTVIALRYWGEFSYMQIAEQTGLTEKNVSMILSRAVKKLKGLFNENKAVTDDARKKKCAV